MKVLIVYCHPLPTSFTAAVLQAAQNGLAAAGHQVHLIDLYAQQFDPVLSPIERERYLSDPQANRAAIETHLQHLTSTDVFIVIYPTWYYGPPAMLKGWLERVLLPDVCFSVAKKKGERAVGKLTNIKHFVGLTTSGSPWWWLRLVRDPGRNLFMRALRVLYAKRCNMHWLQLHNMNNVTPADCQKHLAKVERFCAALH
jgi:NAD(P)H dehydrogenase (quinone)